MKLPFHITCQQPYLVTAFHEAQTLLSWAMIRPGFQVGHKVAWLEVRDADLPQDLDPFAFLEKRMAAAGHGDAIALMTSRDVRRHHLAQAEVGTVSATCLTTIGLRNATRVGCSQASTPPLFGTINILVHVSCALSQATLIETISIVTQARTAAVLALDYRPHGEVVSGTGTDCIVVAAPQAGRPARFAGLHTPIGEAVGAAVLAAVSEGGAAWCKERNASRPRASA
ncbi:adenosylcobinamide amidohydrolase [Methylorubrum populi]|uniref:adenosylcobinamide amidohydrolase n=1 Tax=Methylorubrum populi TaxID=223967 RepID=UPI003F65C29E